MTLPLPTNTYTSAVLCDDPIDEDMPTVATFTIDRALAARIVMLRDFITEQGVQNFSVASPFDVLHFGDVEIQGDTLHISRGYFWFDTFAKHLTTYPLSTEKFHIDRLVVDFGLYVAAAEVPAIPRIVLCFDDSGFTRLYSNVDVHVLALDTHVEGRDEDSLQMVDGDESIVDCFITLPTFRVVENLFEKAGWNAATKRVIGEYD